MNFVQSINNHTFKLKNIKSLLLATVALLTVSACATVAIATVAITTIDIIHDRRTAGEYIDDNTIEVKMKKFLLARKDRRKRAHVNPTSWNGILLLTGEIVSDTAKKEIFDYAKQIQGVRQVVDEATIAGKTSLIARTNDAWITTKVKTKLIANKGIGANRIKVVSERGNVYLMGIVKQTEAESATAIARSVGGVQRVVKVFEYIN